ncbi:CotH kinase family protein [Rosistilla oblonga]|uniref:CotH kinase family protein n=1 Tax=Rosistilla oblonga TaxID=2527990 RepID=UPI003A975FF8
MKKIVRSLLFLVPLGAIAAGIVYAQRPGMFGFGPGGPGGPGGPNREERKIVKDYDVDGNGWLNADERQVARKAIASDAAMEGERRGRGGPGGPGGRGRGPGGQAEPGTPGPKVDVADVAVYPDKPLYDPSVLRTVFLEFENNEWETELEEFHGTDVDVPATMIVDGKTYEGVGVHFRGASSFGHVPRGSKRSFNVSLDTIDEDQRIDGYKTLNLLNCHGDPSMMSSVVYSQIVRKYIPAPKANFVHVVVNGESWGLYNSVQQFDKTFLKENFDGSKGTRWKVPGNPGADGGMRYLGDDLAEYKSRFEMKSNDGEKEWQALIDLCKTLNETPPEQLVAALEPILDIDETLKFLALDVVLLNGDGYWTRASDYNLFRSKDGKFHIIPHDMNEGFGLAGHGGPRPGREGRDGPGRGPGRGEQFGRGGPPEFRPGREFEPGRRGGPEGRGRPGGPDGFAGPGGPEGFGGPGGPGGFGGPGGGMGLGPGGRGPRGGGVDTDPLIGLDSDRMPLRSRLLAVPELRSRYMQYVREIAADSVAWDQLGPMVEEYRNLIDPLVKADTRKLSSYEAFQNATTSDAPKADQPMSLRKFAEERSKFLLSYER